MYSTLHPLFLWLLLYLRLCRLSCSSIISCQKGSCLVVSVILQVSVSLRIHSWSLSSSLHVNLSGMMKWFCCKTSVLCWIRHVGWVWTFSPTLEIKSYIFFFFCHQMTTAVLFGLGDKLFMIIVSVYQDEKAYSGCRSDSTWRDVAWNSWDSSFCHPGDIFFHLVLLIFWCFPWSSNCFMHFFHNFALQGVWAYQGYRAAGRPGRSDPRRVEEQPGSAGGQPAASWAEEEEDPEEPP